MDSNHATANQKVLEMIRQIDPKPDQARPVTFWFYSKNEANICRLACLLQSSGYNIVTCERSVNGEFLCIAGTRMKPDNEEISRRCIDLNVLAGKMQVTFDGWEMEMNIE
jgi:hypothetical protein